MWQGAFLYDIYGIIMRRVWFVITFVLIILILFFARVFGIVKARREQRTEVAMTNYVKTPEGFTQAMTEIASFAVTDAKKDFGVSLDYSPESVELVDNILGKIYEQDRKRRLEGKELAKRELRFGAYVGEVIRRKQKGHWKVATFTDYDPMKFQITFKNGEGKDNTVFPVNWCGKRILNGDEDNVWHKYLYFVEGDGKTLTLPNPPVLPSTPR
jgi:hypothetical protein